jgi:MEMO1 family protein
MTSRPAAVAGSFYPGDRHELATLVDRLIAERPPTLGRPPTAIVAPHAGYVYAGPVAGHAFAELRPLAGVVRRVVVAGPSHFVRFAGVATTGHDTFDTPLGSVPIDEEARRSALTVAGVGIDDVAHRDEHSIEVQLPFLQRVLGEFRLLPLLTGDDARTALALVLDRVWGGGHDSVLVVSTDLSHYFADDTARAIDRATADVVVEGRHGDLAWDHACGVDALAVVVAVAQQRRLTTTLLDLATSADTIGRPDRVVGYGAFCLA